MSTFIWGAIGFLGIGGATLALVGFTVGFPVVFAFLQTKVGRYVALIGVAVLVAFGVYAKGRLAGRAAERARLKALTAKEVANAAAERKRIDALTDAQVDAELEKWSKP